MPVGEGNKLILAFLTLIIGIVFVGVIATSSLAVTTTTVVTDEGINIGSAVVDGQVNESLSNFTLTNVPSGWQAQSTDCNAISVSAYGNVTEDFTLNTDYEVFGADGIIHVLNTTTTENGGNSTLVDYTYCADDYLHLNWGRTLVNLIGGFFAIALLLISVGLFYSVAKDNNIF